jgi:Glycine transporter
MYLPFPSLDLFSAGVRALNGAPVARNPSHNRGYTAAGLLNMGFLGGFGGGVSRDLPLNEIPSPIKDPSYILVCLMAGLLGRAIYRCADSKQKRFRKRILAFFKSFTPPWFASLGIHKALDPALGFGSRSGWPPGHYDWRGVDRCALRPYTGNNQAVRTHCYEGNIGGWSLGRNCAARRAKDGFLSRHPGRSSSLISRPRVCSARSSAADRANERTSGKANGRATGWKASALVSEPKSGKLLHEENTCM